MSEELTEGSQDSTTESEDIQSGETSNNVQETDGQPTTEESSSGLSVEQLQESVKYHQGEKDKFHSELENIKDTLSKYGGIDQIVQWADYLSTNQEFAKWVQGQQQNELLGANVTDADEDTQKAIDIVNKIADAKSQAAMNQIIEKYVKPLHDAQHSKNLEENMNTLRERYGDNFDKYRHKMGEIVEERSYFPENPNFKELESLYWDAVRESGDFDTVVADIYRQKIESAKAKDTGKSSVKAGTSNKPANSIWEAYQQAKQQE